MDVFHSEAWLRVLEETYGFKPVSLRGRGGGYLPLMEARNLFGKRGVSLPFSDYSAPLAVSLEQFRELWNEAIALARSRGWKYLELRGGKEWLPDAPASLRFYRHVLDVRDGEEALFARFEGSVRQAIRKAEKCGLAIEIRHDPEGIRAYYGLHCQTRKKHGLPPQPSAFFLNIQKHLLSKGLGVLVLARSDQIVVAGAVFFCCGKQAIFKFGASDQTGLQTRANNLVMWEGIRWLGARGCENVDFGRTSLENDGLRRFKAGWGTQEGTVEYVKYHVRHARFVVDKDRASGWHTKIFGRMPMPLLRIAGALLYRQMT